MKDAELPQGLGRIEGQKTADFSAAAALAGIRLLGASSIVMAGVAPAVMTGIEPSFQCGLIYATAAGGGIIYLTFPKVFPRCLWAVNVNTSGGTALSVSNWSLSGVTLQRVDGANLPTYVMWTAVGC